MRWLMALAVAALGCGNDQIVTSCRVACETWPIFREWALMGPDLFFGNTPKVAGCPDLREPCGCEALDRLQARCVCFGDYSAEAFTFDPGASAGTGRWWPRCQA